MVYKILVTPNAERALTVISFSYNFQGQHWCTQMRNPDSLRTNSRSLKSTLHPPLELPHNAKPLTTAAMIFKYVPKGISTGSWKKIFSVTYQLWSRVHYEASTKEGTISPPATLPLYSRVEEKPLKTNNQKKFKQRIDTCLKKSMSILFYDYGQYKRKLGDRRQRKRIRSQTIQWHMEEKKAEWQRQRQNL